MATGFWLVIIGIIFYFLKNMYQKVILKKSDDEILLEELKKISELEDKIKEGSR